MTERSKPILCVDFDGVIHDYKRGWQDGAIYGNATPGFFSWLVEAVKIFKVVVYSSRSKTEEGRRAMAEAIGKWSIEAVESGELPNDHDFGSSISLLEFASEKPPAFLTIDDRALRFDGRWPRYQPALLAAFKPWNAQ